MSYIIFVIVCLILHFLPVIIPKRSWLRYYACYVAYAAMALTASYVTLPLYLLLPSLSLRIPQLAARLVSKVVGIDWELRNKCILDKYEHSIVVINHQSIFDFLGLADVLRPYNKYIGVAKKEIYYVFPFGQLLKLFGHIFIDRNDKKNAMAKMKESFMKQEKNMIVFPEGTRNRRGHPFLPFKKGAFRLAVESKKPIIPIVLSPYYFITAGKLFTGGKIVLSVMEPIITKNLTEEDIDNLSEKTKELMEKEYAKIKEELSIYM